MALQPRRQHLHTHHHENLKSYLNCEVADKNTTFRLSDVDILMKTALNDITKTVWQNALSMRKVFKMKIQE
jgi:hypothetical protein